MNQLTRHLLILIVVAGAVFFANLGAARLWDRDEPRNAGCAREMIERGDWVVPYFNDEVRVHKPILLYWLMIGSYTLFDVSEFTARLPSALQGLGTVLLTYFIGRRLFNPQAAVWAGAILATCIMFGVVARAATPDSTLCFTATLAMFAYVYTAFPKKDPAASPLDRPARTSYFPVKLWHAVLIYAAMGLATLAKGPVGFIVPAAVIGMFLLITHLPKIAPIPLHVRGLERWKMLAGRAVRPFAPRHFLRVLWMMRPITLFVVVMAVALPWYLWVHERSDGVWTRGFFLEHNIGRAAQAMEGHGGGPWYYPGTIILGFFPWIILLVPAFISAIAWVRRRDNDRPGYLFALCWACVWVGVFTVASTKLPTYITPMYPAMALLTGAYIHRWQRGEAVPDPLKVRLAFGILAFIGVGTIIGLAIAMHTTFGGGQWLGAIGIIPIIGAIICWRLAEQRRREATMIAFGVMAGVFVLTLFAVGTPVVDRFQLSHKLLAAIDQNSDNPSVHSFGRLEPSWVFYLGRTINEIPKGDYAEAASFLEGGRERFLITTLDRYERLRPTLPADVVNLETIPYFGREGEIVVIGRHAAVATN
jgi:4-amino-4-deoxy-L-arabinose transferase-like glycosyltransferase